MLRETMIFTSNLGTFLAMFKTTRPSLVGEDLMIAPEYLLKKDFAARAKTQGQPPLQPGERMHFEMVMPGGEIPRIVIAERNYTTQLNRMGIPEPDRGRPVWDIHQNVLGGVRSDSYLPTVLPGCCLWSSLLKRPAEVHELMLSQGIVSTRT